MSDWGMIVYMLLGYKRGGSSGAHIYVLGEGSGGKKWSRKKIKGKEIREDSYIFSTSLMYHFILEFGLRFYSFNILSFTSFTYKSEIILIAYLIELNCHIMLHQY